MKSNLIKEKGWYLLIKLFKKANEDREITFDEGRIIKATDLNVTKLLEYSQQAWEDKKLTETEKQKMMFLLKKIKDDAVTLAQYDEIITDEEEDLLEIIKVTVETFFRDDYYFSTHTKLD
ncbi:MAG: hypothetical protein ACW99A_16365 [Candidatus Kariarchaeaceae archaeon]|jgi:hypothetical protein